MKSQINCSYCKTKLTKENKTIDHIIPLSHEKGTNETINLTLCCRTCNLSKHNKDLLEWAKWKKIELDKEIIRKYNLIINQKLIFEF